jgi:hypothetical protein
VIRLIDYAGAGARLDIAAARRLPAARWGAQPKRDGVYVRARTDRDGRIVELRYRSGELVVAGDAGDLVGVQAGPRDAVIHGELEAHTEAGVRARETRGWALLHLFDLSQLRGRDVAGEPYGWRYGALHHAQALLEQEGLPSRGDRDARGALHDAAGRYTRGVPRDVRRCPVVPMLRGAGAADRLWQEEVEAGGGEGLVMVALDAPLRARGAKRKVKSSDTLDCRVLRLEGKHALLEHGGQTFIVAAGAAAWGAVRLGDLVAIRHDGWFERGCTPRFARLDRVRADLSATRR